MAARTATTTKVLEWTRRRITQSASKHRTVADQFSLHTSNLDRARLSTYTAPRQAQKHIIPGSIPKQQQQSPSTADPTTPIAQPLEQTLDRRLRFLSKTRSTSAKNRTPTAPTSTAAGNTAFFDHSNQPSSNNTNEQRHQQRHRKSKRSLLKSYRPGFQPGDFICPQCGTHNFRSPEHAQVVLHQSTVVRLSKKHDHLSFAGQHGAGGDTAATGAVGAGSQTQQQHQQPLTRFQREIIPPQRKYPQGAAGHCFECGFQTSFTPPSSSSATSQSSSISTDPLKDQDYNPRNSPSTASTTQAGETHEQHAGIPSSSSLLSAQYRNDIRLTNPRDYVCPHCQTVNYSNRLHCVGCGTLAPWIQTRIVEQTRHSPSHRRSTRRVK
ncbi:hypothetical protein F5H01DRAFT_403944 [Linnemannia elongata]|nr:hypothetical protein F5H01DRAFT_403944 [Linnemannia elongata]